MLNKKGNSGGPVMQDGKVVGVAFQGYSGDVTQGVAYMIPTPVMNLFLKDFFFSSRRRHTSWNCDWSSDVCSSDLGDDVRSGHTRAEGSLIDLSVQAAHDFGGIEHRAPRNDEGETREQHPEVGARVVAGADAAVPNPERADHTIEQRHDAEGADDQNERAVLQSREPGDNADVVPGVVAQSCRVGNAEVRWRRREDEMTPPVPRAQRQERAQDYAEQDRTGEERAARHGFDDFQIAATGRHLH